MKKNNYLKTKIQEISQKATYYSVGKSWYLFVHELEASKEVKDWVQKQNKES